MSDASLATPSPPVTGEDYRGLHYPFGRWSPETGRLFPVADGVFWLRMPLPFKLDHINLWVLDDGDGWAIVDTGLNMRECKEIWSALFDGPLAGRPVSRVIVTHYHPDHLGLAGWLCRKWDVPLSMSRGEFLLGRMLMLDVADRSPAEAVGFYARAGWPAEALARFETESWGRFRKGTSELPLGHERLRDGDVLRIGGRDWRVVTGNGHSPEHVCLVCDVAGLMISGDQVLPRITSNVSVYPTEPHADQLGDWLASIEKLRGLDAGLRVLPAHNEPFEGLHDRLDQLHADHMRKLEELEAFCTTPRTAHDCFTALFGRPIGYADIVPATGEALAHIHFLEHRGRLARERAGAVDRFVRVG